MTATRKLRAEDDLRPGGARIINRSLELAARRAEHAERVQMSSIASWSTSLAAPPVQLQAFDESLVDLHDAVAVGNHEVFGDPLPARLGVAGAVQLRERLAGKRARGDIQAVAASGVSGAGAELPHREKIQAAFGEHDVSAVRAHTGADAVGASRAIGASAYATGDAVAFASQPDLHLAAHEAAHVVQQRAGVSLSGGVGQAGDRYERHADAVADAVVRGEDASSLLSDLAGTSGAPGVQRAAAEHAAGGDAHDAESAVAGDASARRPQGPAAPTSLVRIEDFIALVQRFEDAYPEAASNWQLATTMLRKLTLYSGGKWDELVADRRDTSIPTSPPMDPGDFAALKGKSGILLTTADDEGRAGPIDVAHVLTGADAGNFPRVGATVQGAATLFQKRFAPVDGGAAASWSGDVASTLARWSVDKRADPRQVYMTSAPSDDLLADIDGQALAGAPVEAKGASLSQRLQSYYLGRGQGTVERRYSAFCSARGIELDADKRLTAAAVRRCMQQIDALARPLVLNLQKQRMQKGGALDRAAGAGAALRDFAVAPYSDADLQLFTSFFVEWLEAGLAAEPS